jgi:regulator of replication initiation timing
MIYIDGEKEPKKEPKQELKTESLLTIYITNLETNIEELEQLISILKTGLTKIIRDNDFNAPQEKPDAIEPANALDRFKMLNSKLQKVILNVENLKQHLERII